ncbi:predicted protein [Lichtheimia corymbifera JMRC:FSU:9682]|uniref:Secreted protein n=1 Tax=Lichtheimia corymbifera JMRC:FSU:9682 TaxID=1263082 RepID=A0A068RSD3_9FUNG|nr:predicted protein [Lichtheimia corymbifera JMRC:FSU:9682]
MKTFAIAVSLAFLGACHSMHGIGQVSDALQDGLLCSSVRGLGVCPPKSLPCAYETIKSKNKGYIFTIKHPCATRKNQSNTCSLVYETEENCLKKGCTWLHIASRQNDYQQGYCREEFTCWDIVEESVCSKHSKSCKWDKGNGNCLNV